MVGAATGCTDEPTPNQVTARALVPLAQEALADAASARALAPQVTEYAAALGVVAEQRDLHAQALREEITRLDQTIAAEVTSSGSASTGPRRSPDGATSAPSSLPAPSATDLDGLRSALRASAKSARGAAVALSGYSAGLAGSVGASVTTLMEVQLA